VGAARKSELCRLDINGTLMDAFETRAINALINPHGLVYSGAMALRQAGIFLAELQHKHIRMISRFT